MCHLSLKFILNIGKLKSTQEDSIGDEKSLFFDCREFEATIRGNLGYKFHKRWKMTM